MINRSDLLKDLQRELPKIEKDILEYSEYKEGLAEHLQEEYEKAQAAGRTAEHFVAWREAQITQAAVAWLLTCVFVRFLEDNNLLVEPMLSGLASSNQNGKETKPLQHAKERMVAFFNENPTLEERDYLLDLFAQLERFPVIAELLDHRHNPLWQIPVSSDGAKRLIDFFQKIDADTGEIIHDFTDENWDTRFLGDLYQDLSESVRKRYALLQTPEFVESFILDYTLEKAIDTFGLTHGKPDSLRLIDPTCGSGHFLLTTFERMFDAWQKREPGTNTRELAQRALDVVHGVDINPYAIAICRFRLFVAAMKAAGSHKVKEAPDFHFNLACGDSLLHGRRFEGTSGLQASLMEEDESLKHVLEVEDLDELNKILGQQYHVVVGNPPYITVKDKALRDAYRAKYFTCYKEFSLGVPFTERFFDLAVSLDTAQAAGYVGMITANSFMKREFGSVLVEKYFGEKDLTHVVDTSGAYIPGHGTPTVILFARNQRPVSPNIRAALGVNGEPGIPNEPSKGLAWNSIVSGLNHPQFENEYISITDSARRIFTIHPWSLGGGGANELKAKLERHSPKKLGNVVTSVGFVCITKQDDVFVQDARVFLRHGVQESCTRHFGKGEEVRDWSHSSNMRVIFPYDDDVKVRDDDDFNSALKFMWPYKTNLNSRKLFNGKTYKDGGRTWYIYGQIPVERYKEKKAISFASVATQNHFVYDEVGTVFKQSAPVIKLSPSSTLNDYLILQGVLNSSVACFWMKQVFMDKGNGGIGGGIGDEKWERRFDHDGTKLKKMPLLDIIVDYLDDNNIPENLRIDPAIKLVNAINTEANVNNSYSPLNVINSAESDLLHELGIAEKKYSESFGRMVALQEELDWYLYFLHGFTERPICAFSECGNLNKLNNFPGLGYRAFELVLAKRVKNEGYKTAWFVRHNSKPVFDYEYKLSEDMLAIINERLSLIETNADLAVFERLEYKRRWNRPIWDEMKKSASKEWLLDEIEKYLSSSNQAVTTCSRLADILQRNEKFLQVAEIFTETDLVDIQNLISQLCNEESVPQVSLFRYKESGIKKFKAWAEVWSLQRKEDEMIANGQEFVEKIPTPPNYSKNDFRQVSFWNNREKLDVPKERFFSLPGCEKDGDSTLVIGWAGMNHLQRATAIATWYLDRKETDGWEAEKLKPMLVAIDELVPWLKQWHNEIDPEFGERMGDYYEGFLLEEMRMLDVTKDDLLAWEPPAAPKKKAAKKKTTAKKSTAKKNKPKSESAEVSDTDPNKEQG